MVLGPVMLDIAGTALQDEERELLRHPGVGGVVLFSRNYESREQLAALCRGIHGLREPRLLIAVDQEGGRVQRFREGFTPLPPMAALGRMHGEDPRAARTLAREMGWLMARELREVDVDLSFAPVVDLDRGVSSVIGDRGLSAEPLVVGDLALAFIGGMQQAGMAACAKHFPGHGGVAADSHLELPEDTRDWEGLMDDLEPFRRLVDAGVAAMMTAHVRYPAVDRYPASFSLRWIREVLRERLGFQGCVVSDDLCMRGAAELGGPAERAGAAQAAGCDLLLVCNDREAATRTLAAVDPESDAAMRQVRLMALHGREGEADPDRRDRARSALAALEPEQELDLR